MELKDIVYDQVEAPKNTRPVDLVSVQIFKNPSAATIEETVSKSITKETSFTWGLVETLKVGAKTEFEGNAPFLGGAKTELSVELGLEAHQTWSKTESETYSVERKITVPPYSGVQVHAYIDWVDDFSTPFTLSMWVSAPFLRIMDNGQVADSRVYPLRANELEWHLRQEGFTGTIIDRSEFYRLLVSVRGKFTGDWGLRSHVKVTNYPS